MANIGKTKSKKDGELEYIAGDWTVTKSQNCNDYETQSGTKD